MLNRLRTIVCLAIVGSTACASIPREAIELSEVASRRVADTQAAHETLVQSYFQLSRDRIEDFLQYRWTPAFLATFVSDAGLMDSLLNPSVLSEAQRQRLRRDLARMVSLRDQPLDRTIEAVNSAFADPERGQIVLEFAEAAIRQIERQRRELLVPIDSLERLLLNELRANYAEMMGIQSAISAYLRSAHDVQAGQEEVLRRLNLLRARDRLVADAITLNESVVTMTDQAGEAEHVLRTIREKLGLPVSPREEPSR